VVVGTYLGSFHVASPDGLTDLPLAQALVRSPIDAILPLPDGFIFSSENGSAQQYVSGFGFCPQPVSVSDQRYQAILRLGDQLVLVGPHGDRARALVVRMAAPSE
jgi:hypothetical protein